MTGSGAGIGASCARRLAAEGAEVILADIDLDSADRVAREILEQGNRAYALQVDVADEESVRALYASVLQRSVRIDVLHNNAAELRWEFLGRDMAIESMPGDVWDRAFAVNTRGTMQMIKHALPSMIAAGGGSIINTGSAASLLGDLANPAYAASKAAVNCLTKYVATQYGKRGIRCNVVAPGLVRTAKVLAVMPEAELAMVRRHTLTPELGDPEDIAAAALWLASDESRFVTGQVLSIDGGITAHLPFVAEKLESFNNDPSNRATR